MFLHNLQIVSVDISLRSEPPIGVDPLARHNRTGGPTNLEIESTGMAVQRFSWICNLSERLSQVMSVS